jgi:hypothetical protein
VAQAGGGASAAAGALEEVGWDGREDEGGGEGEGLDPEPHAEAGARRPGMVVMITVLYSLSTSLFLHLCNADKAWRN